MKPYETNAESVIDLKFRNRIKATNNAKADIIWCASRISTWHLPTYLKFTGLILFFLPSHDS